MVRGRRSCRQYKKENVDPELLKTILDDLAYVPTGCNDRTLKFLVINETEAMEALRQEVYGQIMDRNPAGLAEPLRSSLGFLKSAVTEYRQTGRDQIFRGAPHLLVVAAPKTQTCAPHDADIALAYFEFLAVSGGLGVCWCGFLEMLDKCLPGLRPALGVKADDSVYGMMFGLPAVTYARTVCRTGTAEVIFLTKEQLVKN
jgi:nitroreductase